MAMVESRRERERRILNPIPGGTNVTRVAKVVLHLEACYTGAGVPVPLGFPAALNPVMPKVLEDECLAARTPDEAGAILVRLEAARCCVEKAQLSSEQAARLAAVQARVCSVCGHPRRADTCSKCPTCCAKDRSQWGSCKCLSHKKQ